MDLNKKSSQKPQDPEFGASEILPGNILQIYVEAILCAFKAQARDDVGMA